MTQGYSRIALIPARSGSRGLKDKNILSLCGKPMIAYSIEAAMKTGLFDAVYVSTDSMKYADIARGFGAEAILRGEALSSDAAPTSAVIEDFLSRLDTMPDYFALLQATSPLRTAVNIMEAAALFESQFESFDFLVSVREAEFCADLVKPIEDDLSLKHFSANFANYARQKHKSYSPNGAIYFAKPEAYLAQRHFFGPKAIAYVMDKDTSVDIDDEIDFAFAEMLMKRANANV
ncbi:MAG: acylneuraminate cytidylyltransferase family protein [Coriobacteriales bacterium]